MTLKLFWNFSFWRKGKVHNTWRCELLLKGVTVTRKNMRVGMRMWGEEVGWRDAARLFKTEFANWDAPDAPRLKLIRDSFWGYWPLRKTCLSFTALSVFKASSAPSSHTSLYTSTFSPIFLERMIHKKI